jgi:hypothetical protein
MTTLHYTPEQRPRAALPENAAVIGLLETALTIVRERGIDWRKRAAWRLERAMKLVTKGSGR